MKLRNFNKILLILFILIGPFSKMVNANKKIVSLSIQEEQKEIILTGNVTDKKGDPLAGVNIFQKGNESFGVISDFDGNYSIALNSKEAILTFSFVGFKDQNISVDGRIKIDIVLQENMLGLDEVVVVGYGTMKRSDLSGSSSVLNAKDYKDLPSTDIAQSMQGRVAGVSISQTSGTPGASTKIRIRGGNSMLGSNNPLIVLDGVAMNINIGELNPNDIASMEILKDASSTAIYGSRGANGVIVINTVKGKKDQTRVQISSYYSFDKIANTYDLLDGAEYAKTLNKMGGSDIFSPEEIAEYQKNGGTDWQNEILQTGYKSNTQVSLSGGSEKFQYFISGSFVDQEGMVINTGQKRYSLRSNMDADINDKLHVAINLSLSKTEKNNSSDLAGGKGSPIWNSILWSPTEPIYNEDGTYNMTDQYGSLSFNPLAVVKNRKADSFATIAMVNTTLKYDVTNHLKFNAIVGVENSDGENANFNNKYVAPTSSSSRDYNNSLFLQASTFFTYTNTFNDLHRLTMMAGAEQSSRTEKNFNATGFDMVSESVGYDNLALNSSQGIGSNWGRWSMQSYLSRISYAFNDRYLLTATYRRDGSSRFQGDNKFSGFPSAAIGWRLSEERFIKNMDMFQNLKIRASWGITGNQAIAPYATRGLLSASHYSYGTSSAYVGYSPLGLGNKKLKWEETTQLNLGLDFSLFDGRLNSSIDVFKKNTDGLLQAKVLPKYNGGGTVIQNIGEIENQGFEFMASYDILRESTLKWQSTFNFSSVKNKVVSIGEEDQIFPGNMYGTGFLDSKLFVVKPGESLGSFYGYNFQGIWQTSEADKAASYGCVPGDSKYQDLNNDGVIDGADRQIIGKALPDFSWGLNNQFSYKNFDLNIMIEGVHGRDVLNLGYAAAGVAIGDARSITLTEASNAWTENNQNTIWPKLNSSTNVDHINSSKWLQDGSYIKFRNISLAYHISKEKIKIGDLKLSLSGQNLITITNYKGYDPETTSTGGSDIDQGLDFGSYPSSRSYTLGVTLNF